MPLKFYFDEDAADRALIEALRTRGFEVLSPHESGLLGADDERQLRWCTEHGYVLVSHNVGDFCRHHRDFLARGEDHSGMVLIRQQTLGIGEKLRRLIRLASSRSAEDMRNRIEFLSGW